MSFGLSRHALIASYVARVQLFEVPRLRDVCDTNSRNVDHVLGLDVAQYLMDAGMFPILAPNIKRAQPRAAPASLPSIFVRAMHYRNSNPGAWVRRTYHRLWATWQRLGTPYRCDEAFLVLFCRRGRLVELPLELESDGLTVYSVTIDLSEAAHHPGRLATIRFSADSWPEQRRNSGRRPG